MTKMQDESGIGGSCMTRIVKEMNSYINTQGDVKFIGDIKVLSVVDRIER